MSDMSRRELGLAFVAAPAIGSGQTARTYVVVGAGVFGAWTAFHLRSAGHNVTLLDQYGPSNNRASSGGETRIIRASYGPDEIYTRMAKRSLALWSSFFARVGKPLLDRCGVLWMAKEGNAYVEQSRQTLRNLAIAYRDLSAADLARNYPQIRLEPGAMAIFEPDSGALMAREAVEAVVKEFVQIGGVYRHAAVRPPELISRLAFIETNDGERLRADSFVFACGPWLGKIFPQHLSKRIFVTRQDVLFFGPAPGDRNFEAPAMPIWIDFTDDRGMYGFPDIARRGFKLAFDKHGPPIDPDTANRAVPPEQIAAGRAYLRDRFPALSEAPLVETRVCQYENTNNGDFLIDRLPGCENAWVVGGGSGHGFKHGPAIGEYVAARLSGAATPPVEPRFAFSTKSTEQKRAVF